MENKKLMKSQVKNLIKERVGDEVFCQNTEFIDALAYACTFSSSRNFSDKNMTSTDWYNIACNLTVDDLRSVQRGMNSYKPGKNSGSRLFYILGCFAHIYAGTNTQDDVAVQPVISKKLSAVKQNVEIFAYYGGSQGKGQFIFAGATLYINNEEKLYVWKRTEGIQPNTQFTLAIECVKYVCDKIKDKYQCVKLCDQGNLGFVAAKGKYKSNIKDIKSAFKTFDVEAQSYLAKEYKQTHENEIEEIPLNELIVNDKLTPIPQQSYHESLQKIKQSESKEAITTSSFVDAMAFGKRTIEVFDRRGQIILNQFDKLPEELKEAIFKFYKSLVDSDTFTITRETYLNKSFSTSTVQRQKLELLNEVNNLSYEQMGNLIAYAQGMAASNQLDKEDVSSNKKRA